MLESLLGLLGSAGPILEHLGIKGIMIRRGESVGDVVQALKGGEPAVVVVYTFHTAEQRDRALELLKNAMAAAFGDEDQRQKALENLMSTISTMSGG